MQTSLIRKARTALGFLFPSRAARRYAALLRDSPEFDRAFYLHGNPRMRRLFRRNPELHYVLFGEALGLSPSAHFSPRAYLFHNPDLAGSDLAPLRHFIETGRAQHRLAMRDPGARYYDGPALPRISATDRPARPAPVAVHLHLFYHDMWPEFRDLLSGQRFRFDLYVTITGTGPEASALGRRIEAEVPGARVWCLPNHGRDIFPFLHLVNGGLFTPYRALCKLHTKKSPHRADGDAWRTRLTAGILGDREAVARRLAAFLGDDLAGVWTADGQVYRGDEWWGANRARGEELAARVGITRLPGPLTFPAGSIYWIKPALLARVRALGLTADDFEPEQALVDATTAHAFERILGVLAADAGLMLRQSGELDRAATGNLAPDRA